ncbi:hypothetical protein D3C78_523940 [compost metagenome]
MQGVIETYEHVIKAHFRTTALFLFETCSNPGGGVLQQASVGGRQGFQLLLQGLHRLECRVGGWLAFPGFCHACAGQSGETGA